MDWNLDYAVHDLVKKGNEGLVLTPGGVVAGKRGLTNKDMSTSINNRSE